MLEYINIDNLLLNHCNIINQSQISHKRNNFQTLYQLYKTLDTATTHIRKLSQPQPLCLNQSDP